MDGYLTALKEFVSKCQLYNNDKKCSANIHILDVCLSRLTDNLTNQIMSELSLVSISDGISCLIDLTADQEFPTNSTKKSLGILRKLSESRIILDALQGTFNLPSTLAVYLSSQQCQSNVSLLTNVLDFLAEITEDIIIQYQESYLDQFLKLLLNRIEMVNNDLTSNCLRTLLNMCYGNPLVSTELKKLEQCRFLYNKLFDMIGGKDASMITYSLILAYMLLYNESRYKDMVFSENNILKTCEVVFDLFRNEYLDSKLRVYVVKLLNELLTHKPVRDVFFNNYPNANTLMETVINLLSITDGDLAKNVLELLLALHKSERTSKIIEKLLVEKRVAEDSGESAENFLPLLLNWIQTPTACHFKPASLVMELWSRLYKNKSLVADNLKIFDDLEQALIDETSQPLDNLSPNYRNLCIKLTDVYKLSLDCDLPRLDIETMIGNSTALFEMLLDYLVQYSENVVSDHWSKEEVLLMGILAFAVKVLAHEDITEVVQRSLDDMILNKSLLPFVFKAVSSDQKEYVDTGVRLIIELNHIDDFEISRLVSVIATGNMNKAQQSRQQPMRTPGSIRRAAAMETDCVASPLRGHNQIANRRTACPKNLDDIISRVENSLKAKGDIRQSDLLELNNRRIEEYKANQKLLEDVIESKTVALQQSEKLLSSYRKRDINYESEISHYKSLMKESVQRSEFAKDESTSVSARNLELTLQVEQVTKERDERVVENQGLTDELNSLRESFAILKQKVKELEGDLGVSQTTCKQLELRLEELTARDALSTSVINEFVRMEKDNAKIDEQLHENNLEIESNLKKLWDKAAGLSITKQVSGPSLQNKLHKLSIPTST